MRIGFVAVCALISAPLPEVKMTMVFAASFWPGERGSAVL